MVDTAFALSPVMLTFALVGAALIGGLLAMMHRRRTYHPNPIGAMLGALLCFLLIEALPALT